MNNVELAKVKAFYYAKVVEFGGDYAEARRFLQRYCNGDWCSLLPKSTDVDWSTLGYCRIKPETVMHPGGEIPKPMQMVDIEIDHSYMQVVFIPKPNERLYFNVAAEDSEDYIKLGLAHATKEAAIAHAKVIYQIED